MPRITVWLCFILLLTACKEKDISSKPIKAVYLLSLTGGEINSADLQQHPEVKVVHSFSELKEESSEGLAIWIDKKMADQVDLNWLREPPQRLNPIVMVGYHDTLYAFREALNAFDIEGPSVDWNNVRVTPGFSVWKWKQFTPSDKSAWIRGYDQPSTADSVLAVTNPLLEDRLIHK